MPERERVLVLDTSVAHAALAGSDGYAEAARSLIEAAACIVLPGIVVHELVWSLRKTLPRPLVQSMVMEFVSRPNIRVEPVTSEDISQALADIKHYHDMLVVAVAKRLNAVLATFDRDMAKLARRHGVELVDWGSAVTPRRSRLPAARSSIQTVNRGGGAGSALRATATPRAGGGAGSRGEDRGAAL